MVMVLGEGWSSGRQKCFPVPTIATSIVAKYVFVARCSVAFAHTKYKLDVKIDHVNFTTVN